MTATPPPGPRDPKERDDDDDPSVRLVDALVEEAARDAAANPGPPSEAARELSRFARSLVIGRGTVGGDGVVEAIGSTDGEPLDTAKIRAMDRPELIAALVWATHGEPPPELQDGATDEQLRSALRARRDAARPEPVVRGRRR